MFMVMVRILCINAQVAAIFRYIRFPRLPQRAVHELQQLLLCSVATPVKVYTPCASQLTQSHNDNEGCHLYCFNQQGVISILADTCTCHICTPVQSRKADQGALFMVPAKVISNILQPPDTVGRWC